MQAELVKWLKDIGENKASRFLSNCRVDLVYVDTLFEMSGGEREWELMDAQIGVPGKYFKKLQTDYKNEVKIRRTNYRSCKCNWHAY